MKYSTILIDFDDTLVDFDDAEEQVFYRLAEYYNHHPSVKDFLNFKKVNQAHWEAFQNNELTKEEVLTHRFITYFNQVGIKVNGHEADELFRDGLATAPIKLFQSTVETLQTLSQESELYIVTNGVTDTQERRIERLEFKDLFDGVFISEKTGYQKPMKEFFDYIFNQIGPEKRENSLIIGDSLTSDILGGINANIDTCWFNYRKI